MKNNQKIYILIFFFGLIFCFEKPISAQNFTDYTPLKCSGKVPADFRKDAGDKYRDELLKIEQAKDKTRTRKKTEKQFSLKASFQVNDLLFSGRVLFGDPTSVYVNKIADVLLKNDPALRSKLRFYVIKSDVVNAFTTQQGIIFINIGLLAQVNNEAELAFVIAHEIGHYVKNHVLEGYVEKEKIKKGVGNYRNMGIDQRTEELFKHSKESESEADQYGLELYSQSAYSLKSINTLFDVLLYSYLPFDEIEFTYDFLEDAHFKVPAKYRLAKEKIKEITAKEDESDEKSTHPNIKKRKEKIEESVLAKGKNTKTSLYEVGESEFKNIQKLARYEVCHIYLTVGKYAKALYSGWLLKEVYHETKFADKVMLMAFYGLSKSDREDESLKDNNKGSNESEEESEEDGTWKEIEGNSQSVYYMLNKFTDRELTVVAAGLAWRLKQQYTGDEFIAELADNMVRDLVVSEELKISDFEFETSNTKVEEIEDTSNAEPTTKTEKIKKKKKKAKGADDQKETKFWKTVFMHLTTEEKTQLKKCFNKYLDEKEGLAKIDDEQKAKLKKHEAKANKSRQDYGASLGIKKIVMMTPEYFHIDKDGVSYKLNLIRSEQEANQAEKSIRTISKQSGLSLVMLDKKGDDDNVLANINMNNQIISWITEKLKYEDSTIVLFDDQYTQELIDYTGTEYLGLTVMRSVTGKNDPGANLNSCGIASFGCFNPLMLGWSLYTAMFGHRGYTSYTFVLFNIKTNRVVLVDSKEFYAKASQEVLDQLLYQSLNGIRRSK